MRLVLFLSIVISLICVQSCTKDSTRESVVLDSELSTLVASASRNADSPLAGTTDFYILPTEDELEKLPQDPKNPLTQAKVELGKMLFFETAFSTDALYESGLNTYSCATCHIPEVGFKPGYFQGIADGGQGFGLNGEDRVSSPEYADNEMDVQSARPLSLINVAFVKNTLWNGRFGAHDANEGTEHLWSESDGTALNELGFLAIETQNMEGLETHRIHYDEEVIADYGYTEMFDAAFPDLSEEDRYSNLGGSLALSAYIRTITASKAPFQDWLKGDSDAMTNQEKQGAMLFFGKANCSNCHFNENLGSNEFHALGVMDMDQRPFYKTTQAEVDNRNFGRGSFTGEEEDMFKFKVPQVYNSGDSPFYFHGSSVQTLAELIEYKNNAVTENHRVRQDQLSTKFNPINLTEEEKGQLLLFLEKSLRDPDLTRYKPEFVLSGNCFPNNDPISRRDLGCN